eukprot:1224248-Pyramimonas_sp.AAC.1
MVRGGRAIAAMDRPGGSGSARGATESQKFRPSCRHRRLREPVRALRPRREAWGSNRRRLLRGPGRALRLRRGAQGPNGRTEERGGGPKTGREGPKRAQLRK